MGLMMNIGGFGNPLKCEKPDLWRGRAFQKSGSKPRQGHRTDVLQVCVRAKNDQTRTRSKSML